MTPTSVLRAALQAHEAGLCVVPPKEDGTKAPIGQWKRYQQQRPALETIQRWYESDGRLGLGLVCGQISGNLEMLEFEGSAVADGLQHQFRERADQAGLGDLLSKVLSGYTERTPSGGFHMLYRCLDGVDGNLKLASRPANGPELALAPTARVKVLIETRGEGGYVITAPSNGGVHPSGQAWVLLQGGFATIAVISADERDALLDLARSFDQMPASEPQDSPGQPQGRGPDLRPGDDFNARTGWPQVLEPQGWTLAFTSGDNQHWRRPLKRVGTSATISARGQGLLYVFSTSTVFEAGRTYSKFAAYAVLNCGGDFMEAASRLGRDGYGRAPEGVSKSNNDTAGSLEPQVITSAAASSFMAPKLPDAVYHGLIGRLAMLIDPYVESSPASVLSQLLVAFGTAVGSGPHFMVGATKHAAVLYLGLVGQTSRARKGTSWDPIENLFTRADPTFGPRIMSGVGSGERLVWLVRDPRSEERGDGAKVTDPGASDQRLLLHEPELARLLTVVNREGSTMSAYLRSAYDGRPLHNEVKVAASSASSHHIGLIGHCTVEDLSGKLREQEVRNGLANRITWIAAARTSILPDPPVFEGLDVEEAATELRRALGRAREIGALRRHAAAQRLWDEWYRALPEGGTSLLDAITSRRESLVIRSSMILALTDGSSIISLDHLRGALALDQFSLDCAVKIFGGSTGNMVADRIVEELRGGPLTKSEIHELFSRNLGAQQLLEAQAILERRGLLVRERVPREGGAGRPAERWRMP